MGEHQIQLVRIDRSTRPEDDSPDGPAQVPSIFFLLYFKYIAHQQTSSIPQPGPCGLHRPRHPRPPAWCL